MGKIEWNKLSDGEIKELSKNWTQKDWSIFLDNTVSAGDTNFTEMTVEKFDALAEKHSISKYYNEIESKVILREFFDEALKYIPKDEEFIVTNYFFNGISIREIAREKGLTYNTVFRKKEKALKRLALISHCLIANKPVPNKYRKSNFRYNSLFI